MGDRKVIFNLLRIWALVAAVHAAKIPTKYGESTTSLQLAEEYFSSTSESPVLGPSPVASVSVSCQPDAMLLTIKLADEENDGTLNNYIYDNPGAGEFNGIVYPAGLGKNSTCLREYLRAKSSLQYILPLHACNTMPTDMDDGTVEYHNSIVVQPHPRLVTGQGRGYHVRCRYRRKELALYHHYQGPKLDRLVQGQTADDYDLAFEEVAESLPSCTMKIFKGDPEEKLVASNVKIGEPVTLMVSLEKQTHYGLLVSDCVVRDGLGWAEQSLINNDGCPLDGEIMGMFQYSKDKTKAQVSFPAHKFPYTASVYYTCNVKLCDKADGDACEPCSKKVSRPKRQSDLDKESQDEEAPATIQVFSGLYVNEASVADQDGVSKEPKAEDEICISQRNFAIGICIAGVILMLAVITAIAIILARRRRPKSSSRTGSSLYSGPYTNTGYSHTS